MTQAQVFQCPACGANLSYDGGPETSFPCQFCGTTVVVPEELRSGTHASTEPQGNFEARIKKVLADSNNASLDPELLELLQLELSELIDQDMQAAGGARAAQLTELLRLARSSKKPDAVNLFRQAFPTMSASEAAQAVKMLGSSPS
jgi:hypothetical protein